MDGGREAPSVRRGLGKRWNKKNGGAAYNVYCVVPPHGRTQPPSTVDGQWASPGRHPTRVDTVRPTRTTIRGRSSSMNKLLEEATKSASSGITQTNGQLQLQLPRASSSPPRRTVSRRTVRAVLRSWGHGGVSEKTSRALGSFSFGHFVRRFLSLKPPIHSSTE